MSTLGLLLLALFTQETLLSYAAIFNARADGYPPLFVHIIWTGVTVLHLIIPYYLGKHLTGKIKNKKFLIYLDKFQKDTDKKGYHTYLLFVILGIFNFVYINSFLLSLTKIKPVVPFILIFLGDLIWYVLVFGSTATGISIFSNIQSFFYALLITILFGYVGKKLIKKLSAKV